MKKENYFMAFKCAKCNKIILFNSRNYLGKKYCSDCYIEFVTTPNCSEQTRWLINEKQLVERGPYKFTTKIAGNDILITVIIKKQPQQIRMHKLFTYDYFNSNSYSVLALNAIDGEPFIISFGYDGGADGDGEWISFNKINYQFLNNVIKKKCITINKMFGNLSADNWQEYLNITYTEKLNASYACFMAVVCDDIVRIAVSRQSNPHHHIAYITCHTEDYIAWKSKYKEPLDYLCDYKSLEPVSIEFLTKSHSPIVSNKYSFHLQKRPTQQGKIDLVIAQNCSTNLSEYQGVFIDNALQYLNLIENECKK